MKFEILHKSKKSNARVGKIHTPHGVIDTPGFVAVGTNGVLKALDPVHVAEADLDLMFCNTYHLILQPGVEVIRRAGGLHKFINRDRPIITDSGGFQVFSLAYGSVVEELKGKNKRIRAGSVLKIDEEGVLFRSYRDGKKVLLTPESSVLAQKAFGADIIIPLDELPPYHVDAASLKNSLERTHRWEKRSLETHLKDPQGQAMYAVVHGGIDPDLRKRSVEELSVLPFDGFSIGGSFGKDKKEMLQMLNSTVPHMSKVHPIHLLGIGDLESLSLCVPLGIDTFDSSYPTKSARHGIALTKKGRVKIFGPECYNNFAPLDDECSCFTCRHYSRAYLHHLFKAKEFSSQMLSTIHNLHFMVRLMKSYRDMILEDLV